METDTLRTGIGALPMATAAEILAHGAGSAGWSPAQVAKAKAWFGNVVWPRIGAANPQRSSNWGTSAMAGGGRIQRGVHGRPRRLQRRHPIHQHAGGQPTEAGRDQGHPQGGVGHLVEVAMTAWNQGTNLVSFADGRLVAGMEGPEQRRLSPRANER